MPGSRIEELTLDGLVGGGPLPDEWVKPPAPEMRKPDAVLNAPTRRLRLFGGHYLEITEAGKGGSTRTFNLAFLDANPSRTQAWPYVWLVVSATCLVSGAVLAAAATVWHAAALAIVGIASTVPLVKRGRQRLTFVSNIGRAPVFVIEVPWLRGQVEAAFAAAVTQRISASRDILPKARERLAVEMAEHRRMLTEGSLSPARYERAKQRILAAFSSGST
jgi:hypothetical protein